MPNSTGSNSQGLVRQAKPWDPSRFGDGVREHDPIWLREILKRGWQTPFPLSALTDEAVQAASKHYSVAPPPFQPFWDKDPFLTEGEFISAYSRMIRMIDTYYADPYRDLGTSTAAIFQEHFDYLRRRPDFRTKTGVIVAYDVRIRGIFQGSEDEAPVWRQDIFNTYEIEAKLGQLCGTHDEKGYPYAKDKPGQNRQPAFKDPNEARGSGKDSFRNREGGQTEGRQRPKKEPKDPRVPSPKCLGCGRSHPDEKRCPNAHEPSTIMQANSGSWVPKQDGERRCFTFNRTGTCSGDARECHKGRHQCTVCGSPNHSAQDHHGAN